MPVADGFRHFKNKVWVDWLWRALLGSRRRLAAVSHSCAIISSNRHWSRRGCCWRLAFVGWPVGRRRRAVLRSVCSRSRLGLSSRSNRSPDCFFFLFFKVPPIRAPDPVKLPTQLLQNALARAVAGSRNQRTVVTRAIAFNHQQISPALLNHNVQAEFASTILTFDFVALVFQKLDNLLLERRITEDDVRHAVISSLETFAADAKGSCLFAALQIAQ